MIKPADTNNWVTGVLLAGGQSRRMFANTAAGQGDKGLLPIAGKPMLAHVMARLQPQVGKLVINANGNASRFAPFGLPVVNDTVVGQVGPLAGVLAGMRWSAKYAPDATHIATVSTDAPFVPTDLVAKLRAGLSHHTIMLAASHGELHPVIGLWPIALADDLERALTDGVRKVLAWTDRHGRGSVDFPFLQVAGQSIDPFFNANTQAELEEAAAVLTLEPSQSQS
jgi:molybdenum cofactor guanylyltransferase